MAPSGVTTQQIYDSVQGLATSSGDSGVRTPGTNGRVTSYKLLMSQRPGGAYSEIEEIGVQFSSTFTGNDGTNSGVFDRSGP